MSAIQKTRPEFLYELKIIMETHSISADLAIKAMAKLYGISWELTAEDTTALYSKGLMTSNTNKINNKKLFKGLKSDGKNQLTMGFASKPKGTEETLKLADNLQKNFVPDDALTEDKIKQVADAHFYGDTTAAEYFTTFKYLFPNKSLRENKKWNKHFGITFTGSNKWSLSGGVPKKFYKIYMTKDIGLFLSGVYYYIKDSIDLEKLIVFCSTPNNFLTNYEQWFDYAAAEVEERKKREEAPEVSL